MCRWAAYIGEPIYIEELLTRPSHSLIQQSQHASEGKAAVNGDGFGIAWYGTRTEPGLYRDVQPAWSDPNLRSIARHVTSPLFLCHVRASTGTATSRNNCHPFVSGRWSFMHNGQVGGFERFRRHADFLIPDVLYYDRKGATDSETLFLLALAHGMDKEPRAALLRAANDLLHLSRTHGTAPHLRLTACFSDGQTLYAVRYATDEFAPSLYHRWSESLNGRAVVSEPLELNQAGWDEVPAGSFCTFDGTAVDVAPFDPLAEAKQKRRARKAA